MNTATQVPVDSIDSTDTGDSHAASRNALGEALSRLSGTAAPAQDAPPDSVNDDPEPSDTLSEHAAPNALNSDETVDDDDSDEPSSRRSKGSIRELRAEIERLRAEMAEVKAPQEQAATRDAPPDTRISEAEARVAALRGTDTDWDDLQSRVVDGLSFEDAERYRVMRAARLFDDAWQDLADARAEQAQKEWGAKFFAGLATHFDAIATKPGVDAKVLRETPEMGAVFAHIYDAGRKDLADENERLKGELAEAKARLAGATPRLPVGGRSSLGTHGAPDPRTADPQELLRAAIGQRNRPGRR